MGTIGAFDATNTDPVLYPDKETNLLQAPPNLSKVRQEYDVQCSSHGGFSEPIGAAGKQRIQVTVEVSLDDEATTVSAESQLECNTGPGIFPGKR